MTSLLPNRVWVRVAALSLLTVAAAVVVRPSHGQPRAESDAGLGAEIVAVQHDLVGAKDAQERAAAQAKLQVLLDEKSSIEAARAKPPATKEEDQKKLAELEASSREAASETAGYSPVVRQTDRGELLTGEPWNTNDRSFRSGIWWRGPKAADGTRLAVWAGIKGADGALLVRTYLDGTDTPVSDRVIPIPGHGVMSIADESGGFIDIRGADGSQFFFDTASGTLR